MKAQELRDRLAAVRNFDVVVDDDVKIEDIVIDITNNTVYLYTKPIPKKEDFKLLDAQQKKKSELDRLADVLNKKGGEDASKSTGE